MQMIQAKCLQVNFQPRGVMEPNSHYYSGIAEVKEQALPCLMLSLSVSTGDEMPARPQGPEGQI